MTANEKIEVGSRVRRHAVPGWWIVEEIGEGTDPEVILRKEHSKRTRASKTRLSCLVTTPPPPPRATWTPPPPLPPPPAPAKETAGDDFAQMREMEKKIRAEDLTTALAVFQKSGAKFTYREDLAQFLVEGDRGRLYYYAPSSGKWRQQGKPQWYHSRSPEEFLSRYALKSDRPKLSFGQERTAIELLMAAAPTLPESARRELVKTAQLLRGHLSDERAIEVVGIALKLVS